MLPQIPRYRFAPAATPVIIAVLLAGLLVAASGAQGQSDRRDGRPVLNVEMDGRIEDWGKDILVNMDGYYLYLKVFAENLRNLQQHEQVLRIDLDVDDNDDTGDKRSRNMGTDLRIEFSPRLEDFSRGRDLVSIRQYTDLGPTRRIGPEEIDLLVLPTHAARYFEVRISRFPTEEIYYPTDGLLSQGKLSGTVEVLSYAALPLEPRRRVSFETSMPARAPQPLRVAEPLPAKPEGAVRLVVWQPGWGQTIAQSARAKRLIEALDPDAILLQRWNTKSGAETAASFFNQTVPLAGDQQWQAIDSPDASGNGVVTVARHRLVQSPKVPIWAKPEPRAEDDTPIAMTSGAMLVGDQWLTLINVALTPGGKLDDKVDQLRMDEAKPINYVGLLLRNNLAELGHAGTIIAGQYNLEGVSEVLKRRLYAGLDGGRPLAEAEPWVHGTKSQYTFGMPGRGLVKGVRAGAGYSESTLELVNSFVLDPRLMTDEALSESGLQRDDLDFATDYPWVMDFSVRGP